MTSLPSNGYDNRLKVHGKSPTRCKGDGDLTAKSARKTSREQAKPETRSRRAAATPRKRARQKADSPGFFARLRGASATESSPARKTPRVSGKPARKDASGQPAAKARNKPRVQEESPAAQRRAERQAERAERQAIRAEQRAEKAARPPSRLTTTLQGVSREGVVILMLSLCVFMLLALFSYAPTDPGWSYSGPELTPSNWMGSIGAWLSDVLYSLFGGSALWWPAMLGFGAWRLMRQPSTELVWDPTTIAVRAGGLFLLIMATCVIGDIQFYSPDSQLTNGAGGILGKGIAGALTPLIGMGGTVLVAMASFLCGFTLFTGMSWLTVMDELGNGCMRVSGWFAERFNSRRDDQDAYDDEAAYAEESLTHEDGEEDDSDRDPAPRLSWWQRLLPGRRAREDEWDEDSDEILLGRRQEAEGIAAEPRGQRRVEPSLDGGTDEAISARDDFADDRSTDIPWQTAETTPSAKVPGAAYTERMTVQSANVSIEGVDLAAALKTAVAAEAASAPRVAHADVTRSRLPQAAAIEAERQRHADASVTTQAPKAATPAPAAEDTASASDSTAAPAAWDAASAFAPTARHDTARHETARHDTAQDAQAQSEAEAHKAPSQAQAQAQELAREQEAQRLAEQEAQRLAEQEAQREAEQKAQRAAEQQAAERQAQLEKQAQLEQQAQLEKEAQRERDAQLARERSDAAPDSRNQPPEPRDDDDAPLPGSGGQFATAAGLAAGAGVMAAGVAAAASETPARKAVVSWDDAFEQPTGNAPTQADAPAARSSPSATPPQHAPEPRQPAAPHQPAEPVAPAEPDSVAPQAEHVPPFEAPTATPEATPATAERPSWAYDGDESGMVPGGGRLATAEDAQAAASDPSGPTLWTVEHMQSQRHEGADHEDEPEGDLPQLSLLTPPDAQKPNYSEEELDQMAELLVVRLREYGVKAEVADVWPGPVITRFEIQPAPGVKASKISNLSTDLARSLLVKSVRVVEVIPGRPTVGIEIPNPNRAMIRLREVFDSDAYQLAESPVTLALGQDIGGAPVVANLGKMPHLLVAGTTGSGKSVGINSMLISMLLKATPDEVRMIMVDPKMLELSVYDGIPHLLAPVVTDMKEAANALRWCVAEMERRYKLMAAMGVRNLAGFNAKIDEAEAHGAQIADPLWEPQPWEMHQHPPVLAKLPYIVVVIDEFADMFMIVGKKVEELIARLAQKARAAGIHLILATQRPSVDVVTGLIKANIPTRMAFQVSSKIDSRTILDQGGAEDLLGHGDMLYLPAGAGMPTRVHGAFVDDDEVHRVVDDWKRRGSPEYIEEILTGGVQADALAGLEAEGEDSDAEQDALYDEAVAYVVESRRASISAVQRRFKIGYNRAARLVEAMEMAGVVSAMGTNGSREVIAPNHSG